MSVYSGFIRPVYALDFYPTLTLMTFDDDGLLSAYGEVQHDPNGDDKYFVNVYRWNGNRYELQDYGSSSSWQDCADLYAGNEDLNYFGWDVFIPTGLDRRVTVDDVAEMNGDAFWDCISVAVKSARTPANVVKNTRLEV